MSAVHRSISRICIGGDSVMSYRLMACAITLWSTVIALAAPINVTYNISSMINGSTLIASGSGTGDPSTGTLNTTLTYSTLPAGWDLASAFYAHSSFIDMFAQQIDA